MQRTGKVVKRCFDIVASSITMLIFCWLYGLLALLVKITIGSPVIFRQARPGYKGREFIISKFRTMRALNDMNGDLLPDEKRLTRFGHFLRKTSLDELPELWNVLKGDMSLVGPRPLMMQYLDRYTDQQKRRHDIPPGITGWAQVNGRNSISWEEKFKLDLWYIDNWSFMLDMKIIIKTIRIVMVGKGIGHPGHATMEEFFGSQGLD